MLLFSTQINRWTDFSFLIFLLTQMFWTCLDLFFLVFLDVSYRNHVRNHGLGHVTDDLEPRSPRSSRSRSERSELLRLAANRSKAFEATCGESGKNRMNS